MAISPLNPGSPGINILNYVTQDPGPGKAGGGDGKQVIPDAGNSGGPGSGGADLTPGGPSGSSESASISLTLARVKSSSGKASELFNKAVVTQIQQEKTAAMDQQVSARLAARDSLLNAASDLSKQASDILQGAIANLVITVCVEAVSIGMMIGGTALSLKGGDEEEEVTAATKEVNQVSKELKTVEKEMVSVNSLLAKMKDMGGEAKMAANAFEKIDKLKSSLSSFGEKATEKLTSASAYGNAMYKIGEGLPKTGESAAGFASSMGQYQSKLDEGQQKVDEANAQLFDAMADAAKNLVQQLDDFGAKLNDFLKGIQEAKTEMMAAVVNKG